MAFTNLIFLFLFFPASIGAYYILKRLQNWCKTASDIFCNLFLILASIAFYGWGRVRGIIEICIYIIWVYIFGRCISRMDKEKTCRKRTAVTASGLLVLTAILYYYKYFNFVAESLNNLTSMSVQVRDIIVPIGISFITFSAISYIVDIYRGSAPAGNLLDTALYLTFFPKVISGPIVLWKDFQPQIRKRILDDERFVAGLNRVMIGFAKKVILADTFGTAIAGIQENLHLGIDMPTAWGCAILYMLQIYYDFAGYSDVAIGLSGMFGFKFKENFDFPYVSCSITEFWRRWHISLGTWFREYIYIPLGGNRKGRTRTLVNLFIVFLVTGIWHGAGWNYICWGILNGICIVVERCIKDKKIYQRIPQVIKWAVTMFIVLISWQIFRFPDMKNTAEFFGIMFGGIHFESLNFIYPYYFTMKIIVLMIIGIVGAVLFQSKSAERLQCRIKESKVLYGLQEVVLLVFMVVAVIFIVSSTYSPFIYFQY